MVIFHYGFILLGVLLLTLAIAYSATISKLDTRETWKYTRIVAMLAFAIGILSYVLCLYYFGSNPTYVFQFLLAVAMLVILPASLMSVSVSTITTSNI